MKLYDGGIVFLVAMALVGWIAFENAKPAVDGYIQEQAQQVPCKVTE